MCCLVGGHVEVLHLALVVVERAEGGGRGWTGKCLYLLMLYLVGGEQLVVACCLRAMMCHVVGSLWLWPW